MRATTSTSARSTAVGVFQDRDAARDAIDDLKRAGFNDDQIGYTARHMDGSDVSGRAGERAGDAAGGALAGAATGGVLGGILGAAASLLIPGVGPVIAAGFLGPLLGGAAAGAAIGAAGGGIIGALTNAGVPEEEARYYDTEFRSGRHIVTVKAGSRYQEAQDILSRRGASFYNASTMRPADTVRKTEVHVDRDRQEVVSPSSSVSTTGDTQLYRTYAQQMRSDARHSGRRWEEIETDLEKDWSMRHPNTPWERARSAIREAWTDVKTAGR